MTSLEHFDRLFVLVAAGLGLMLAGGVNLLVGTRTWRRTALGGVGCLAACGTVAVVLFSFARGELAVRVGTVMVVAVAFVAVASVVLRSAWFHRHARAVVLVLWGLLTLGGAGLTASAMIVFDRTDAELADKNTLNLESTLGRQLHQPTARARAVTDRGATIVLKEPIAARDSRTMVGPEEKFLRGASLTGQVIRNGTPTDTSNCYGWVFTGGKYLLSPDDVEAILKDNGYMEVHEPQPGDVVIYRQTGSITHSAVVRYVTEGQPVLIEGKWGAMGVFLHPADKTPYGTDYTFHRSGRRGHLLVGVGGTSPDPTVVAPSVAE